MILGFKKQFKAPILAGTKIHTLREDEHDRWHAGIIIHMATGVRTKDYDCFKMSACVSTQRVFMTFTHLLEISIGGKYLYYPEKMVLAKNDGFATYEEFEKWFYDAIKKSKNDCFSGKIIHWTHYRY